MDKIRYQLIPSKSPFRGTFALLGTVLRKVDIKPQGMNSLFITEQTPLRNTPCGRTQEVFAAQFTVIRDCESMSFIPYSLH